MNDALGSIDANQLDIFCEIGSIGSGNATTALASLLNRKIDMSIPDVQIVQFNDIINILNGPESLVVGILVNMSGNLNGYILMILEAKDAFDMLSMMLGSEDELPIARVLSDMSEMELSALTEMANILVGAYLSAICSLTSLSVQPSVPQVAIDMVGAIISIVAIEYSQIGDSVLFLKTQFWDVDKAIAGHFFLIPDFESYKVLMKSLGIEM